MNSQDINLKREYISQVWEPLYKMLPQDEDGKFNTKASIQFLSQKCAKYQSTEICKWDTFLQKTLKNPENAQNLTSFHLYNGQKCEQIKTTAEQCLIALLKLYITQKTVKFVKTHSCSSYFPSRGLYWES